MDRQWFNRADFLQNLFDAIPSSLFVVDNDGRVHDLNIAALNILGQTKDAVLLKRGGEILHCIHSYEVPEGCGRSPSCKECVVRNSVGKAFSGAMIRREAAGMKLLLAEGRTVDMFFMITACPLDYQGRRFVLLVIEDVTKEKIFEQELHERSMQLEAANTELEAFSYSVSHDLKAPLRGISGFSSVLLEEYADRLDETGKGYLMRLCSASAQMGQLIDALLKLSRITRNAVERETVDLSEMALAIAADLKDAQPECNVGFIVAPGISAIADRRLIRIALENLFGNGMKFAAGRPDARIEFGVEENRGRRAFFVRDNGIGFDTAYSDRLFTPFQRLHSQEEYPGSGIGLATVRRIIRRHGGDIWAEGEVGKGATFFFTL
jgi:signal transduction histidine kinase